MYRIHQLRNTVQPRRNAPSEISRLQNVMQRNSRLSDFWRLPKTVSFDRGPDKIHRLLAVVNLDNRKVPIRTAASSEESSEECTDTDLRLNAGPDVNVAATVLSTIQFKANNAFI